MQVHTPRAHVTLSEFGVLRFEVRLTIQWPNGPHRCSRTSSSAERARRLRGCVGLLGCRRAQSARSDHAREAASDRARADVRRDVARGGVDQAHQGRPLADRLRDQDRRARRQTVDSEESEEGRAGGGSRSARARRGGAGSRSDDLGPGGAARSTRHASRAAVRCGQGDRGDDRRQPGRR